MSTDLLTLGKTEQTATPAAVRSGLYPHPHDAHKNSPSKPGAKPGRKTLAENHRDLISKNPLFQSTAAFLKNHALEIDGWSRKLSITLAHLAQAQHKISAYETQLEQQKQRIALLEELATSDELTGLKNRRGFYDGFLREVECCERGISQGGLLVLIDLDHFKKVNDTYGHAAGDAVLKLVGRTLRNEIRKMDVAARMGGDEFILLMSNTTQAEARAQLIGWQLNNLSLAWYGDVIPVQASVGVRAFGAGELVETVLSDADSALYKMKSGRSNPPANEQGGTAMIGQSA